MKKQYISQDILEYKEIFEFCPFSDTFWTIVKNVLQYK